MAELNYHHLRYFWAVAQDGNLTRAAERLHVSQSSVSVQIKKLEAQLGQQLFERRGRQLELTEAGSIALDYANTMFDLGDELLGTLSDQVGASRRVLRVGAQATLSRNFQISFLQPLLGRENVELGLSSGTLADLIEMMEAHRVDVVLANVPPHRDASSTWVPRLLDRQQVSLVAPPDRLRKGRRLNDILANEPLLLPSGDSGIRTEFDVMLDELGIQPRIAGEIDDMALLRLMARESGAFAVVPSIVVRDELETGLLAEVRKLPGLFETFYAITPSRRFPNRLLRELMPSVDHDAEIDLHGAN